MIRLKYTNLEMAAWSGDLPSSLMAIFISLSDPPPDLLKELEKRFYMDKRISRKVSIKNISSGRAHNES